MALASELKRLGVKRHRYIGNAASLTGLTYFSNLVLEGNGDYLAMNSNGYFRQRLKQAPGTKTQPLLSMANKFDPLSANKIDPLGATKNQLSRLCFSR